MQLVLCGVGFCGKSPGANGANAGCQLPEYFMNLHKVVADASLYASIDASKSGIIPGV
jgi:hypothetical protein